MLIFEEDAFNGLVVDKTRLPTDKQAFSQQLDALIAYVHQQQKKVIWLTLPIELADYVAVCTAHDFVFHTCLRDEVTLIRKSDPTNLAPYEPTHSLGAGGFVQNPQGQLLVIKERGASNYKLPGGHVELGEKIEEAVVREVYEETGIRSELESVLAMATTHPYQFGKSNIYYVCRLVPLNLDIEIVDSHEIADAKWVDPQAFIQDEQNGQFNRYLVSSLLNVKGLGKSKLDVSKLSHRKHEIFIAS